MTAPQASGGQTRVMVEGVTKVYHPSPMWMRGLVRTNIHSDVVALDGIDFSMSDGEVCAVVGPNGAGKTTTFRILVGLTTPSSGKATVMGYDASRQSVAVRRLVGWMPGDDRSLLMRLTCSENLHFHGRLQGMKGDLLRRKIGDTLDLVGLGHAAQKTVFALSAGMRARLQLARALLHDPEVLILDEPTGSVDPVAAHQLVDLMLGIVKERNLAALVSSHRLEEIEALGARVILLDRGKILYDGDLDDLREDTEQRQLEITFVSDDFATEGARILSARAEGANVEAQGTVLRCSLATRADAGVILKELEPLLAHTEHIDHIRRPLRDLLADMYRREQDKESR